MILFSDVLLYGKPPTSNPKHYPMDKVLFLADTKIEDLQDDELQEAKNAFKFEKNRLTLIIKKRNSFPYVQQARSFNSIRDFPQAKGHP